jgi:hypothetical protein
MKKTTFLLLFFGIAGLATFGVSSLCAHKKTPGEKLDDAIDKTKDKIDDAKDWTKDKIDHAKDKVKDKLL